MGLVWNQRGSRTETTTTTQEGLPVSVGVAVPKKKWSNLMPLFVALVVIAEIAFLGRLDMAKNAAMVADCSTGLVWLLKMMIWG
jgi:glycoprotein 3-alpha-L-fucosyltransferase